MENRQHSSKQQLKKPPLVERIQTEIVEESQTSNDEGEFVVEDLYSDIEYQERKSKILVFELNVSERQDLLAMRRLWSKMFVVIVVLILIFEIGVTVAVGMKYMVFADEWFLRIIILGGIAQILAMPYLVTQFLFNKDNTLSKGS